MIKRIPKEQEETVIDDAIDAGVNAMFLHLQEAIGQNDGGIASIFFVGGKEDEVKEMLRPMMAEYLRTEYAHMEEEA